MEGTEVDDGILKRICYISPLSIHSARWIEAFVQKKYLDVFLISDSQTWVAHIPMLTKVFTLPTVNKQTFVKRFLPNSMGIARILKKIKPDIVNLHVQHHYSLAIVLSQYPYVLTSWGLEVLKLPHTDFLTRTLAKTAATFAQKIIVDAKCLREIWTSVGIPKKKIEVIPFGVDINIFRPHQKNTATIRRKLQIKQSDLVVISTRPFYNNHYNIECLIRAIPLIIERHENVKFILKGAGPLENYLRTLVEQLRISEYVRFVGLTSHNEVASYLAASNIYVSTSFLDSTSVSLLEAMACGLAPVVTDIPGNREWIENGVNGFLFPPKNPTALAEKVIQLVEDENLRQHFGERCIELVEQKARWEDCVSRMEAIYQSILS
jgi:glycosyltransferase involved in cell wall biosynthesis